MTRPYVRQVGGWLLGLVLTLSLGGCWGAKEVGDMSIVIGLGVDRLQDGSVQVTAQVVDPTKVGGGGGGGTSGGSRQGYLNKESTGRTLEQAMEKFYENSWRPFFVAHTTLVVFGANYARSGIEDALDYFDRSKDFRRIQMLAVTPQDAKSVLEAKTGIETLNARSVRKLIENQVERGASVRSIQLDVLDEILEPSHSPLVASVEVDEKQHLKIGGMGLFQGDKLVGFMDFPAARGVLWFLGEVRRTQLLIPSAANPSGCISLHVLNATAKVQPQGIDGKESVFSVSVRGVAEIQRLCPEDQPTSVSMKRWEGEVDKLIEDEMASSFSKLQQLDVDATHLGTQIFRTNPGRWRQIASQWPTEFRKVQIKYDIKMHILRSGMATSSSTSDYTPQAYPPEHGRGTIK